MLTNVKIPTTQTCRADRLGQEVHRCRERRKIPNTKRQESEHHGIRPPITRSKPWASWQNKTRTSHHKQRASKGIDRTMRVVQKRKNRRSANTDEDENDRPPVRIRRRHIHSQLLLHTASLRGNALFTHLHVLICLRSALPCSCGRAGRAHFHVLKEHQ